VIPAGAMEAKKHILYECHDSRSAGHFGVAKTINLISRQFVWPKMNAEIREYVSTCLACQSNKSNTQLPIGLLHPLPIPPHPWHTVTMDLITQLPRTKQGHTAVFVVVDKLTKYVTYIPTVTEATATGLAELFIHFIVRYRGLPRVIVSDRDPRFTSIFWQTLWSGLNTQLHFSTAFHPQTDGQTERANRTLEEGLRAYVQHNQLDWDEHLVMLEIAFNQQQHASTGFSPFYLNSGREIDLPLDHATKMSQHTNQKAAERLEKLASDLEEAKKNLAAAQERQAFHANKKRRQVVFKVGDRVMLSTEHLKLKIDGQTSKLLSKYIGPFTVTRIINDTAYELDLPHSMRIHPVFHVSKLKAFRDGSTLFPWRTQPTRPPPEILPDGDEVWEVERIISKRIRRYGRTRRIEYLVHWKGYPEHERTWEPSENLQGARQAVEEFEASASAAAVAAIDSEIAPLQQLI
jgi:hypothetical protein